MIEKNACEKEIPADSLKKNAILVALIFGVLLSALMEHRPSNRNMLSPTWYGNVQCISIAISELKYGLAGHLGYKKVYDQFYPHLEGSDKGTPNLAINAAIELALHLDNVSSSGTFYGLGFATGLVDYYKLAFYIFGYRIESVFYLFSLLVVASFFVFAATFYDRPVLLFVLLLLSCGFLVMARSPVLIYQSLTNQRYLTIPPIVPTIYLALLVVNERRWTPYVFCGALVQMVILVFCYYARSVPQYQFMFLIALLIVLMARNLLSKLPTFANVRLWPMALVLCGIIFLQGYIRSVMNPIYLTSLGEHIIWHNTYMGLAAHPRAVKHGIVGYGDMQGVKAVQRLTIEKGLKYDHDAGVQKLIYGIIPKPGEIVFLNAPYEQILRGEVFRLLRDDFWFVFNGYLYKLFFYFRSFWATGTTPEGAYNSMIEWMEKLADWRVTPGPMNGYVNMSRWYLVAIVMLGAFMVKEALLRQWRPYLSLVGLNFLFALIPPILSMPISHSNVDSGIYLSAVIYLVLSVIVLKLWEKPQLLLSIYPSWKKFRSTIKSRYMQTR